MPMIRLRRGAGGVRRWQWRVRLTGYPIRTGTCPTKECAKKCAAEAEETLRSGGSAARLTMAELFDRYESVYLPTIPDSAIYYTRHLTWWRQELGPHFVSAVTPLMIAAAKAKLATRKSRYKKTLSPATVNRHLTTLSSVFSWATSPEVRLAARNPVRMVSRLKEPPGRVRWLSRPSDTKDSELDRLLKACEQSASDYLLDVVLLLISTGCRENEVMSLRREQIRLQDRGFTIPRGEAKTEEPRFVPLEGVGLDVVARRLAKLRSKDEYFFPGRNGRPKGFPWRSWRTALKKAEIENLRPHDLRHTHGSYLAMMGKTLPEIKEALGHRTDQAAMRYIHLSDLHKQKVSGELNRQLETWIGSGSSVAAAAVEPVEEPGLVN